MTTHIMRTITQCIDDARQLVHYLLVDPRVTTAQTMLTVDDMPTRELGEIWQELVAIDDAMHDRDVATLTRRLRRRGVEPGRELRCVVKTDTGVMKAHWQWCCDEIRRHREQAEQYRAAVATLDRLGK